MMIYSWHNDNLDDIFMAHWHNDNVDNIFLAVWHNDDVDNIFAKELQTIPLTFWSYILDFLIVEHIVAEFSIMISTVKIFSPHDICPEKFPTR